MNNVYKGDNAILDYLNPDGKYTPLLEIPASLNPYKKNGVRIFAKLMGVTPLFNIKSYPAFNMLQNKRLDTDTLIESSSGNTAMSLTILGKLFGIKNAKVIVSNTVAEDKLNLLRVFGAEVIVNREPMCPDKDDPESGINKAKALASHNNWFNGGQYDNQDNPGAHYKWTGSQIWEQIGDDISVFSSTLGTTGTMVGAGKFLKEKNPNIKNIGVISSDDKQRLGPRTKNLLKEIAFDWRSVVDDTEEVGANDSFVASMNLCRNGILAGPSSGFTYLGLLQYIQKKVDTNFLQSIKNKKGEVVCVFICPDTPFPYIHEYINNLDDRFFPKIINEELLGKKQHTNTKNRDEEVIPISCEDLYKKHFGGGESNYFLADLRKKSDYDKFRIADAKWYNYHSLTEELGQSKKEIKGKKVILTDCGLSNSAKYAVGLLRGQYSDITYLLGGMDKWTKLNLPCLRNTPVIC